MGRQLSQVVRMGFISLSPALSFQEHAPSV